MNKIDLIIDALENSEPTGLGWRRSHKHRLALAAAHEMKALKPIAWITDNYEQDRSATTFNIEVAKRWKEKGWRVAPLYALDEVKHD